MKKTKRHLRNFAVAAGILGASFGVSLLLQNVLEVQDSIMSVFVFAVFLVSVLTDGYIYGIITAFVGVIAVNYAFTFPYFAFSFTLPENFLSVALMIIIALVTGTLTTRIKSWQAIKAEGEKEKMRANLLRAVSHDLRTPLTTIYGSSSAITDNYDSLSDEQKKRMAGGIKEDSEWLIRIVENLLSVTKIDGGKMKLIKSPTVLDELVDSVLLKFRKRYPDQEVEIDIPEKAVIISMDAILIEQVVINLLENAVQHAVGMKRLALKVSVKDGICIFEISDDGCGIERDRLEKIFTGYYDTREQPSDKEHRNAGIGLSVCATIIKAHGGSIRAESTKGCGATFLFMLDAEEDCCDE